MSCAILLVETVDGEPTEFDGKYLKAYDPTVVDGELGYDGGLLEVTPDLRAAMHFSDLREALNKYRQSFGVRSDGQPNRPLTAWTITFVAVPEAAQGGAAA